MLHWLRNRTRKGAEDAPPMLTGAAPLTAGASGIFSRMRVFTEAGWRAVGDLTVGDQVLTFDDGWQPLCEIQRDLCASEPGGQSLVIQLPEGALGNDAPIALMPDQGLLWEGEGVRDAQGDPFAILRARALVGLRGVHLASVPGGADTRQLVFPRDAVIYAEAGMRLSCPAPRDPMDTGVAPLYSALPLRAAQKLVANLPSSAAPGGFTYDREELETVC